MLKYILLWFPMLVIAVLNGTARDMVYTNYTGELAAHQISTVTLIILFGIYIWFVIKKFPPASSIHALYTGFLWLVMTLIFEFGFGFARGLPIEKLLNDYNLINGRIWVFIPVWVTISPVLLYKVLYKNTPKEPL